ncbi:MAG: ATP-binding protein [Anaerolineae bacterium]
MQSQTAVEHVTACLARLDLQIRREVVRLRQQVGTRPDEEFRGLYISNDDVDRLLDEALPITSALQSPSPDAALSALEAALAALDHRILNIEAKAQQSGDNLPLLQLAKLFGLDEFARQVIIICLAAETDLRYERLFAYLQDDVTKKRPTVALVLRLLGSTSEAALSARCYFEPDAPLLRWRLVSLNDDPGARRPVLLSRYLKLDERIANFLLGSSAGETRLEHCREQSVRNPQPALAGVIAQQLAVWSRSWDEVWEQTPPVVLFYGRYGTGKRSAALELGKLLSKPVLLLCLRELASSDLSLEQGIQLAEREALLTNALIAWTETDQFIHPSPEYEEAHRCLLRALAQGQAPTVLLAEKTWEPARELAGRPFLRLAMPELTYDERRSLWDAGLDGDGPAMNGEELDALAGRYRLTAGQIRDALLRARILAWTREPGKARLQINDIDAACRSQAQNRLGTLARKLQPHFAWEDIVLPRAQLTTLHLICTTVRHRSTVYGTWGFDRKLSLSKGLIALFAGPSGTGKTMAAEIIANDLGLDVYKIDLSSVVSKYIGETEKNLERIFSEAQDSDAILFFDEADALFGKRSEVKDAHDRYANIEIAYLLQRTEEYNGLVILASNVKKNMDEAFVRRLHFIIDFPFPEEAERLEIWKRTFPRQVPLDADIDLPFLARKFKMAGGNIRNIILTAAFLAADEHSIVCMRHLIRGASYEYQKMGKLVVEGDFEGYFDLVKI